MKSDEVLACSFANWYGKFEKITVESSIIPIPEDVLAYLKDSGTVVLPEGLSSCPASHSDDNDDSSDYSWEHCETSGDTAEEPRFDCFNHTLNEAVQNLGGSVFPKLNWSAPKDATWITFSQSLKCCDAGDIYLLLKSSTLIGRDLTNPFEGCDDEVDARSKIFETHVILRRWTEINPSQEFRCFVRSKELVGISQRDLSQYYECLQNDCDDITADIDAFWKENICNNFALSSYVFDVYRPAKEHVILLDFSPFSYNTDPALFTWPYLMEGRTIQQIHGSNNEAGHEDGISNGHSSTGYEGMFAVGVGGEPPEMRIIADKTGLQPSPNLKYGLPEDLTDLYTGRDPYKLIDFLQVMTNKQDEEDSMTKAESDVD